MSLSTSFSGPPLPSCSHFFLPLSAIFLGGSSLHPHFYCLHFSAPLCTPEGQPIRTISSGLPCLWGGTRERSEYFFPAHSWLSRLWQQLLPSTLYENPPAEQPIPTLPGCCNKIPSSCPFSHFKGTASCVARRWMPDFLCPFS